MEKIFISFAGAAGAGKSTTANELKQWCESAGYTCEIIRFIGFVKHICKVCYGLTDKQMDTQEGKSTMLDCGMTVRELLDYIGMILRGIDIYCMVNAWHYQVSKSNAQIIIADDVRFDVEAAAVFCWDGSVIRLTRANSEPYNSISERSLSDHMVTEIYDNTTKTVDETVAHVLLRYFDFDRLETER